MYGGIERVLGVLARGRRLAPEMEPEFALCFRGRSWDELAAAGVPVHDLGPVRVSRPWTVLRARRRAADLLADGRFAAAVAHACWPHAVLAPAVRRAGVRLATWVHDALSGRPWVERWAARTPPDVLLANSHYTLNAARTVFPDPPGEVVHPPVEFDETFDPAAARTEVRAELGTRPDAVVVLMLARLERVKGHAVLLDALGRLRELPGWEAWVAGGVQRPADTGYLAGLTAAAGANGIAGRVKFLGHRPDATKVLAAADVYCQPNVGPEGFGLTFVEAMAAGLPVVTSAIGGGAEVVDPSCGVLTPPGDAAAAADALRGLITDPRRRAALGAAGPGRARALCDPRRLLGRLAGVVAGPHPAGATRAG
jgi:glycosyltransferase involved in cell wall biosynthesis